MTYTFYNKNTGADFRLTYQSKEFDRAFYGKDRKDKLLTIAWNVGKDQQVVIDNAVYNFPKNSILPLMVNQSFVFQTPSDIVAWQFNRDFYCIVNHDKEVSCVGFLFYGALETMFVRLDKEQTKSLNLLLEVFKEEFLNADNIQGEMLRVLLVRLIIKITRLAKEQYLDKEVVDDNKFDLYRRFNLMVENYYKTERNVAFYAAQLHKSPKTLANVFAIYGHRTPMEVIQDRVILEAKRLFYYTDKSAKEVAGELGFEDAAHFSKFFKTQTGLSPTDFKKDFAKAA